jgi:hypothetical protein
MAQYLEPYEPGRQDNNEYYVEQLCSIGFGGLMAAIVCKWYFSGDMKFFMSSTLMPVVLAGGIALLSLIVFRAVVVWRVAGEPQLVPVHDHGHGHGHGHGADCEHEHDHGHSHGIKPAPSTGLTRAPMHGHGHSHGGPGSDHEHAWAPWRYMIMLVPIILGLLGLPASGLQPYPRGETDFGNLQSKRDYSPAQVTRVVSTLGAPTGYSPLLALAFAEPDRLVRSGDYVPVTFTQLEEATLTPDQRKFYTGRAVQITGQFTGDNERYFSLTRYKINCCGADAIPLKSVIVIDYTQFKEGPRLEPRKLQKKWVQVSGIVQFKDRGNGAFIPMIVVTPTREDKESLADLVKEIPPPGNPYVN